jgi:hypothetical protein
MCSLLKEQNMDFMPEFITTEEQTQLVVPLRVTPFSHKAMPTITGSAFSHEAGTVMYGNYTMEYLLPNEDRLRLIANHNKKTVQLLLFTHDAELIKLLPGDRPSSLVADMISRIHRYRTRSASYQQPLSPDQKQKLTLANECIHSLNGLLKKERKLNPDDFRGHEELRKAVLTLLDNCRDGNRMIANNPVVSEGTLGSILYDAHKAALHYQFNRAYKTSHHDQLDFSKESSQSSFVWDSELHIGHNSNDLDEALRVLCQHYQLTPAHKLNKIPANRFAKLADFFRSLWNDGRDWINYLAIDTQPTHNTEVQERSDGVSITKITPYYTLKGLSQKGYDSLRELAQSFNGTTMEPTLTNTIKDAEKVLGHAPDGNWAIIAERQQLVFRVKNNLQVLHYFVKDQQFYPLPDGEDLYTLSQISKRHLYLPERISLRFKAFISRIPTFFQNFYQSMSHFIIHDLHQDFINHVHATHRSEETERVEEEIKAAYNKKRGSVHDALENKGLLANGQTLEEFIREHISNSPYIIAQANHPPSPHPYDNPLHRILGVLRHIGGFFIDTSERNPMIGSLAIAAYLYGGGAVLAPNALASLLTKLHLNGLIAGIEPVQKLAHFMSHGTTSEAISASVTLWQGMVAGSNLDKFFVEAVSLLKEDPGEIAIIAALALSLGYGITKAIPSLQKEMGDFPYTNYAALGGKGGAALYDTIMHPGDDWLLGTCKWLCKHVITLGKLVVAPFIEAYYYGYENGFINGWKKSWALVKKSARQAVAALGDFALALCTVPFTELSSLLFHIPFRGITNFIRLILSALGNFSAIGRLLISAGESDTENYLADFRFSPLYGFSKPWGQFSSNLFINLAINALRIVFLPPLQLIKNIIILPLIDILALTVRLTLTVLTPIFALMAYSSGWALWAVGQIWDNSAGILFSSSATVLTLASNWLDNQAGELKQSLLSQIEVSRSELYSWAFQEEDLLLHKLVNDEHYYLSAPRRCELLPHSESHCLLNNLLNNNSPDSTHDAPPSPLHTQLFIEERTSAYEQDELPLFNLQNQ